MKARYIQAVCRELEMRKDYLKGEPVRTVYFGGGTPSQLEPADFELLFETLEKVYGLQQCEEITLEANPDDLTPEYLQALSRLPFNRLSIGIQTFNDNTLQLLRRRHTSAQAIQAVKDARSAGFKNISIDLIYGLPNESIASWSNDLSQAIALHPDHISAYHLTYEEGTSLYFMLKQKQVKEVSEDNSLRFYSLLTETLSAVGYEQYEISNFCLPDKYSRHNSSYWQGVNYLGCGASAHSYNGTSREWNISSLTLYIIGIAEGFRNFEKEELDINTRYNDRIVTSLRTTWGLSLEQLATDFGEEYVNHALQNAQTYLSDESLIIVNDHLRLTPKGVFISDRIMSELLIVK